MPLPSLYRCVCPPTCPCLLSSSSSSGGIYHSVCSLAHPRTLPDDRFPFGKHHSLRNTSLERRYRCSTKPCWHELQRESVEQEHERKHAP
eukprot:1260485-Pleurochrysis_carterae.AAC.1